MNKIWNFSAGPAMLPHEVLSQAQAELINWQGRGLSVMEISHRSSFFEALAQETMQDLRALLTLPEEFEIIFTTGGAQAQFAFIPMNLLTPTETADYLVTGHWSARAAEQAKNFAPIHIAAGCSSKPCIPQKHEWQLQKDARYFHYATNETIDGVQFHEIPAVDVPLIADMSSDFLSQPIDFSRFGLIYACAQKNIGIAGLTVILIRRDYLARCTTRPPTIFNYATLAAQQSMPNTPVTYSWYLAGLVFQWLKRQGGLSSMAVRNQHKAQLLYDAIDTSTLYFNTIPKEERSVMNVVFDLRKQELLPLFLTEAEQAGLLYLKGHRVRGGIRASIYNAMPEAGVLALINFMQSFEEKYL